jgi:hypothetical protein
LEDDLTFDQDEYMETYIGLLEDENRSLHGLKNIPRNKQTSVEIAFDLVLNDSIARNSSKKRARAFMDQVLSYSKELFVLCGMGTNQTAQGKVHITYLERFWE